MRFVGTAADVEALAASVEDNGGVVLVPAFTGLGAPHWDPYAGGLLIGLGRGTQRGHIARAALESIALQVMDVLDAIQKDSPTPLLELRVDGGAAANDLLMHIQADLLGVPVTRPPCLETTALGAAYLAGLAVGYWSSMEEIKELQGEPAVFLPRESKMGMASIIKNWRRALERSTGWYSPQ
jgi:glycerol kinase